MPKQRLLSADEHDLIAMTRVFVETQMNTDFSGHDHHHVFRVYALAMFLAKATSADPLVIALSSLLHDIDDPKRLAPGALANGVSTYLATTSLPSSTISHIQDIIATMSFSSQMSGKKVATLEGKIVQDADRLDAIGAIGIGRAFAFGGHKGRLMYQGDIDDDSTIAHFYQKLLKLEGLMNTPKAKQIAAHRTRFLRRFLKEFESEWNTSIHG